MEPESPMRLRWRATGLLLGAAFVAAGVALAVVEVTALRPRREAARARALAERYEAAPNAETAQALAVLLDGGRVPRDLGNHILKLLNTPEVAVRAAYPAGRTVYVASRYCYDIHFPETSLIHIERARVGDKEEPLDGGGGNRAGAAGVFRSAFGALSAHTANSTSPPAEMYPTVSSMPRS